MMQIPRYVTGAALFALIWASIIWVQHGWNFQKLVAHALVFFVLATVLSWLLNLIVTWLKNRR